MQHPFRLEGVVPIVPTPFDEREEVDCEGVANCVRFAARCGLSAICLPAYASEFYKLSEPERERVVATAIAAADGRIAVVAQSNHPSAKLAAELARRHQEMGADLVSFAVPRMFGLKEADVLAYCAFICSAVEIPVLIQDFNPGGATVGPQFARELHRRCPNFQYLKLEEPLMAPKVRAVRDATDDCVGVLEGWGGMFLPELVPAGICGLMPSLGAADLLQRVWILCREGKRDEAMEIFQVVLPQLVYALQNLEFLHHMEKDLLAARGIIAATRTTVRGATWTPDPAALEHGRWLNQRIVKFAKRIA
jgi:2-keto-3-deoxy-L-arabinonate dehydratase